MKTFILEILFFGILSMICFSVFGAEDWRDTEYVWDEEKGRMVEVESKEKNKYSGMTEKERKRAEYKERRKAKKEAAKKKALELKRERKAKKDAEKQAYEKYQRGQQYMRNYIIQNGVYAPYLRHIFIHQSGCAPRRGYAVIPPGYSYQTK